MSKNLQTIHAGEDVEKREPSYTVSGNVNLYSQYGEYFGKSNSSYITKTYDLAILLLGIYSEKIII